MLSQQFRRHMTRFHVIAHFSCQAGPSPRSGSLSRSTTKGEAWHGRLLIATRVDVKEPGVVIKAIPPLPPLVDFHT